MIDPAVRQLSSSRLLLRRPHDGDKDAIRALADDWEVAQWMGRLPHPYRIEHAEHFVRDIVPNEPCWAITDRVDGVVFGIVGLAPAGQPDVVEFGYWLGRAFWGRGYATEAGQTVLDHAFETVGLAIIASGYFAGNMRSAHVLDKLGFRACGMSRRMNMARGAMIAHADVTLSRERWREGQS